MKTKEALALTKFETEITSLLESTYKVYKTSIPLYQENEEYEGFSRKALKKQINLKFNAFLHDLGYQSDISEDSLGELRQATEDLKDKSQNIITDEEKKLLNTSNFLIDEIERFNSKIDNVCNDFFEKAKKEPELANSKSFAKYVSGVRSAILGAAVGFVAAVAVALTVWDAAANPYSGPDPYFPLYLTLFVAIGACMGFREEMNSPENSQSVQNEEEKAKKLDIGDFSKNITQTAETLKSIIALKDSQIKLDEVSEAEGKSGESAEDRLNNKSQSPDRSL